MSCGSVCVLPVAWCVLGSLHPASSVRGAKRCDILTVVSLSEKMKRSVHVVPIQSAAASVLIPGIHDGGIHAHSTECSGRRPSLHLSGESLRSA